jgi:superfamily II DNA/RNA helicase
MTFKDFYLSATSGKGLEEKGYRGPLPIQAKAIPHLPNGRGTLRLAQVVIAARVNDFVKLPFLISNELRQIPKAFTHRVGRTSRAWQVSHCCSVMTRSGDRGKSPNSSRLIVADYPFN